MITLPPTVEGAGMRTRRVPSLLKIPSVIVGLRPDA